MSADTLKRFTRYLEEKKLRMTRQRALILERFCSIKEHISAEELYDRLKTADPAIGQATVYRMLKLLADGHLATRIEFGDGIIRYEPSPPGSRHYHMICEICQRTVEFRDPVLQNHLSRLAGQHGFKITEDKVRLLGICAGCAKTEESKHQKNN